MNNQNYHKIYAQTLRNYLPSEYFRPVPSRLLWLIPHLVLIVGCAAGIVCGNPNVFIKLALALVIGHSFACWGFLGHEILHGSVVKVAWLRDLLGGLCMSPFNLGPMLWRWWHNVEHHGHTQRYHRDPDTYSTLNDFHQRPGLRLLQKVAPMKSLLFFPLFGVWFTTHSLVMLWHVQRKGTRRERVVTLAQYLLPLTIWLSLGMWLGWTHWAFFYLVPLFVGNFIVIAYIATNHLLNPLLQEDDPVAGSLTVTTWRVIDILHLNFSCHTEHHIFPAMNPKYAPQVKALLKKFWLDKYQEMSHGRALLTLWRTPRLYLDEVRLVDPHTEDVYGTLGHGLDPHRISAIEA
jgi:fatty acid desaturase